MKASRCILIFLTLFALILAFVQISEGVAISREKQNVQSELVENESSTDKPQQLQKKQGMAKKSKYPKPIVIEKTKKYSPKPKYKMTELKPCISKAFCEVNAITEEPTYETNKEFYLILSRLKKFTTTVNERDLNGSGSFEDDDDDSGSSEEPSSYERVPLHDHQSQQSQDQPLITNPLSWFSGLRRGKSLNETDDKALLAKKHKKINKLKKFLKKSNAANSNGTKTEKILTPAQIEKRELVARKTKELNVVDDLAALIKISAEIGQALRSPRRCRNLFKKCQMSYDQIIGIFNQSQSVETSEPELFPTPSTPTFPSRRTTKFTTTPYSSTTTTSSPTTEETTIKPTYFKPAEVVNNYEENISIEDGNRDKKSRTDFSDEDYAEADGESQPVKTYSLLDQVIDRQQQPQQYSKYEDDDAIDEGFQMFDKAFPSTAPKTTGPKSKKYQPKQQQVQPSGSSEEDESSSVSAERLLQNDERYSHRASGEANDFNDVSLKKHSKHPQAEADEVENDSDQEIPSSEIDKRPVASNPQPIPGTISGEQSSEEQSDEENRGQQEELYTRDEQEYTYPHYPNARPSYDRSQNAQRQSHKPKNQKKQKKTGDDSSEERPDAEEFMPPSNSKFYQVLKTVDNGKGASVIPPGTNPYEKKQSGHRKKGKRNKKRNKHEAEDVEDEVIYSGQNGPYGQLQASPSVSNYYGYNSQQSADQSSKPSIFQSIMGWFRGNPGSDEQQQYGSNVQQHGYGTENGQQQFNPYGSAYPQQNGYNARPSQQQPYSEVDSQSWKNNKRHPSSSQGRREDDSSEEEEEEDDQDFESVQQQPNKKEANRGRPQQRRPSPNLGANNGILVNHQGPPPPLVIDPGYPQQVPNNQNNRKNNNNNNINKAPEVENEESKELTSSEEILDKQEQKAVNNKPQKSKSKKPLNDKVFDDLYLSAVDMDKHAQRQKEAEDRENTSLLLSTFDSIANKFSTSANKVPNWDEEDNPKKKINVASLHTNGHLPRKRYTVQKNKHKSQASYEANEEIKNSSEEEEEDKK